MGMDDEVWTRHASSWSVWTRVLTALPLLALAIWSRIWIGPWCLLAVAAALFWIWLNPRLFSPPANLDGWAARGVMGERVYLKARQKIARHHKTAALALAIVSGVGIFPFAWGLWQLDFWATLCGIVLIAGGKIWFVDRMAWIWDDFVRAGGSIADLPSDQ